MGMLKIRFFWITAHEDRTEHAVSDEDSVPAGTGVFEALCGIEFLAASMDIGPARRCPSCAAFVRARNTLRDIDDRIPAGRRSAWLSRLSCSRRSRGRHAASDTELINAVRNGELGAYAGLYERHRSSAYNLARQLSRSEAGADDLVSEAFAKVLDALLTGGGPDSAFRAYLLTALRHTAYDKTRRDRKLELCGDVTAISGVRPDAVSVPFTDTAIAGLERSLAAHAFARLPEPWQAVLWHTEIKGHSAAAAAAILGLTPAAVSALAYRAREGLRQNYLQVYLAKITERHCRATTDRLGAWTRNGLAKRERAIVGAHLDECARCQALATELADINSTFNLQSA